MMFAEDQLPISVLRPDAEGPVTVLFRSKPRHAADAAATARHRTS
jgi:hypothetical protein